MENKNSKIIAVSGFFWMWRAESWFEVWIFRMGAKVAIKPETLNFKHQ